MTLITLARLTLKAYDIAGSISSSGHVVWDVVLKYFYDSSYNKEILYESLIISPILPGIQANKIFLTFLVFNKLKQNENNKGPRYHSLTVSTLAIYAASKSHVVDPKLSIVYSLQCIFRHFPLQT